MKIQTNQPTTQKYLIAAIILMIFPGIINLQAQEASAVRAQVLESSLETLALAEALNAEGVEAAKSGKITEAAELFQKAIRLRPDYTAAYGNLGKAFYYTRQFSEAIVALKKTIELKSDDAEVYNNLGVIYVESGRTNEAVVVFKRTLELQPNMAMARYNLGNAYVQLKKFKQAVPLLEQAVRLEPNNADIRSELGYALRHLKKYDEAIAQMQEAVRLQPQFPKTQIFLGQLYLLNGDRQSALAHYRKLTAIDAQTAQELYNTIYRNLIVNAAKKSNKPKKKD